MVDYEGELACVAAVSFPFPGGDRTSKRENGRAKEHAWVEQKIGEKWGGSEREGEGDGGDIGCGLKLEWNDERSNS